MTIICKHFQLTHSIARSTAATDGRDGEGNHRRKENLIFLLAVGGLEKSRVATNERLRKMRELSGHNCRPPPECTELGETTGLP